MGNLILLLNAAFVLAARYRQDHHKVKSGRGSVDHGTRPATDSPQLLDEFLKTMKGGATARGCGCGEALRPSIWSWDLSLPAGTMLLLHQLSWLGMLTQTIILRFCICALDLSGRGCMRPRLRRTTGRARRRRGCRRGSAASAMIVMETAPETHQQRYRARDHKESTVNSDD